MTKISTVETLTVRVNELEKHSNNEIDHLREIIANSAKASERALELQASEYERRLNDLNHEAARITASQSASVSRERFDGYVEGVDRRLNTLEGYRANIEGKIWGISLAVGVLVTAINIGVRLISK